MIPSSSTVWNKIFSSLPPFFSPFFFPSFLPFFLSFFLSLFLVKKLVEGDAVHLTVNGSMTQPLVDHKKVISTHSRVEGVHASQSPKMRWEKWTERGQESLWFRGTDSSPPLMVAERLGQGGEMARHCLFSSDGFYLLFPFVRSFMRNH